MAWQINSKPYCLAKETISGTMTAFLPVPRRRAKFVLSIMPCLAA